MLRKDYKLKLFLLLLKPIKDNCERYLKVGEKELDSRQRSLGGKVQKREIKFMNLIERVIDVKKLKASIVKRDSDCIKKE